MKVSGTVERLFEKAWRGNRGNTTLFSFQLKGDSRYYRLGENRPQFRETDYVEFEADEKGNASNLTATKAEEKPAPKVAQAAAAGSPSGYAGGHGRESYWEEKGRRDIEKEERYVNEVEPRITFCSAQSDAVKLVGYALQYECLTFGNANKSAKLGMLLDYVDQVTMRFARQRMQASDLMAGAGSGVVETPQAEESNTKSDLDG